MEELSRFPSKEWIRFKLIIPSFEIISYIVVFMAEYKSKYTDNCHQIISNSLLQINGEFRPHTKLILKEAGKNEKV